MRYAENDMADGILKNFHQSGAVGGRVLAGNGEAMGNGFVFTPDTGSREADGDPSPWPCYRFSAALRKNHPYSDLKSKLSESSFSNRGC